MCFPNILVKKNNWISEFRRINPQELKCWSTFCVYYFLRYYLMMQHQPIVKRVNGTHEWAHMLISSYQLLITAACTNTGGKIKGSHSIAADRCPFVPRHSLSQVTSFMQLGTLWERLMGELWEWFTSVKFGFLQHCRDNSCIEVGVDYRSIFHTSPVAAGKSFLSLGELCKLL